MSRPTLRHSAALLASALAVVLLDQGSKALAETCLAARVQPLALGPYLRLALVHNDRLAFGLSVGSHNGLLSIATAVATLGLTMAVCSELARVDRLAPWALGLVAGAATGNLLSLVTSPVGVTDFVAIGTRGRELVFNGADVAAYAGLALLIGTARQAMGALRDGASASVNERAPRPTAADVEVRLPIAAEPGPPSGPATTPHVARHADGQDHHNRTFID